MVHWHVLSRDAALNALEARLSSVAAEIERLERVRRAGEYRILPVLA